ncbi:hypothetical protein H9636_05920 [Ureibacillus sp. Re31]|uniref:Proteinase inhibitor I42 chagasin domain-containing protein n=1 Tax=Ureibacillus galli TaxID=2762222 RepID=A0ABR8XA42_9BACL|nr:hypothetical protein [Ureibacillus galli]MBD8026192.1 hypothetical protein [Ureibacillus galli]
MKNPIFLLLLLLFFLFGCSNTENKLDLPITSSKLTSPPKVEIEIDEEIYPTSQGSYCWNTEKVTECVDMATPTELMDGMKGIKVSRNENITLHIERTPSSQKVTVIDSSGQTEELKLDKTTFSAPIVRGTYIVTYYGVWEKDDKNSSGDSSYIFKIEVK